MDSDKPKILIVDKYLDMQKYLAYCIKDLGQIICTSGTWHALDILASSQIDLIICELSLPFMNGAELCEEVKEIFPDIPFILMTSLNKSDARSMASNGLHDALIYKPFEPNPFRKLSERLLGDQSKGSM